MQRVLTSVVALLVATAVVVPFVVIGGTQSVAAENTTRIFIADWEDDDVAIRDDRVGSWTGDTGMLSIESANSIDGSYSLNSTASSTISTAEASFGSVQSPDTISFDMRVDQISGSSSDNVNVNFYAGDTRVFEIFYQSGGDIRVFGASESGVASASLGEELNINVTRIDWADDEFYVEVNGVPNGPYEFTNSVSGYDTIELKNDPNDGGGQTNSYVIDDIRHNRTTSLDRQDWSFENQPADAGFPDDWTDANVGTGTVNVTTMAADDGQQSLLLSESSSGNSIGAELYAPLEQNITTDVSASLYKSDAVTDGDGAGQIALKLFEGETPVVDVGINESGYLQYKNTTGADVPITLVGINDWSQPTIESIDPAADTYDVRVGGVLEEDVPMVNPMNSGYNQIQFFADTRGLVDNVEIADGRGGLAGDVTGRVRTIHGNPIPNATVIARGTIAPSETEAREDLSDLTRSPTDLTEWRDQVDSGFDPLGEYAQHTDATYPLLYEGTPDGGILIDSQDLSNPAWSSLPAQQEITVVVGDGSTDPLIENEYDRQIPGVVAADATVRFERLSPSGEPTAVRQVEIDEQQGSGLIGSEMQYATTTLTTGIYRVHVLDSPTPSYLVKVGNPTAQLSQNVRTLEDRLTNFSEQVQNARSAGSLEIQRVETNADGEFSVSFEGNVGSVRLTAIKPPGSIDAALSVQETDLTNVSEQYTNGLSNESLYTPTTPQQTTVPASDVTLQMREISYPSGGGLDRLQNLSEWREELLSNLTYEDLPTAMQQRLESVSRDDLENQTQRVRRLAEENDALRERIEELSNDTLQQDTGQLSAEQLAELLRVQQQALTQTPAQTDVGAPQTTTSGENITLSREFGGDIDEEDFLIRVDYTNGTTRMLDADSEFVSVNSEVGNDVVVVEDLPLGEAAGASVQTYAATNEGLAKATTQVTNPTFSGTMPDVESLDISSLYPGPDEDVSITLDGQSIGNVSGASITGPSGGTIPADVTADGTVRFTTHGAGIHTARLDVENPAGRTFQLPVRVEAANQSIANNPTIRVVTSPLGTYAQAGDGLTDGTITVNDAGTQASVMAVLDEQADVDRVRVDTSAVSLSREATVDLSVVQGRQRQAVNRHVPVTIQTANVPDDALLYRNGNPMGSSDGTWTNSGAMTQIKTYTTDGGTVSVTTNASPSFFESTWYRVQTSIPDVTLGGILSVGAALLTGPDGLATNLALVTMNFARSPDAGSTASASLTQEVRSNA